MIPEIDSPMSCSYIDKDDLEKRLHSLYEVLNLISCYPVMFTLWFPNLLLICPHFKV
jgi:hypothetical protein